jgi:hypothetical protein
MLNFKAKVLNSKIIISCVPRMFLACSVASSGYVYYGTCIVVLYYITAWRARRGVRRSNTPRSTYAARGSRSYTKPMGQVFAAARVCCEGIP